MFTIIGNCISYTSTAVYNMCYMQYNYMLIIVLNVLNPTPVAILMVMISCPHSPVQSRTVVEMQSIRIRLLSLFRRLYLIFSTYKV